MQVFIPPQTFIRHAGNESLLWNRRNSACVILQDAKTFLNAVTYAPQNEDEIIRKVAAAFEVFPGFQFFPVGNCYKQTLKEVWENSPQIKYLRSLRGKDIPKCIHCKDRNYCSMCLVRNFNETGDMLKVAEHFCKVAELNHQIVDELHARLAAECQTEHKK